MKACDRIFLIIWARHVLHGNKFDAEGEVDFLKMESKILFNFNTTYEIEVRAERLRNELIARDINDWDETKIRDTLDTLAKFTGSIYSSYVVTYDSRIGFVVSISHAKKTKAVDDYLDAVKAMRTPEAKSPIDDSSQIENIRLHCEKLGELREYKGCSKVVFSGDFESIKNASRSCLVEHLKYQIKAIKAGPGRKAAITKWSKFLGLFVPPLNLGDDLLNS